MQLSWQAWWKPTCGTRLHSAASCAGLKPRYAVLSSDGAVMCAGFSGRALGGFTARSSGMDADQGSLFPLPPGMCAAWHCPKPSTAIVNNTW
jgi:hypothetical protein